MGGSTKLGCLFVHRRQGLFYRFMWMILQMPGKKQNMAPVWKKLMNNVDTGEPTSFLDHVYLGCSQRECKQNEKILGRYAKMFESRISVGAAVKLPGWETSRENCSVVLRHARTCSKMC